MKIVLLHGDDTLRSYERLQKFIETAKSRGWDIERITDNTQALPEVLVSQGLFQKQKLVIVEGVNLITKKDIEWLKRKSDGLSGNLVIYHQGTIPQSILKSLPKVEKIEEFKLPKLIWKFLDSFYPGNAGNCLKLLHETVKKEPIEFVFSLLARHLRDLYWAKLDSSSLSYPSWRIANLKKQSSNLTQEQLRVIINDLAKADIEAKTSKVELLDSLDFIIATKLE